MESVFRQQSVSTGYIELDQESPLTEDKRGQVIICNCEFGWPHARVYSLKQYQEMLTQLLDLGYEADEIEQELGEIASVNRISKGRIPLEDEWLNYLSAIASPVTDLTLIYGVDGTLYIWDERTAPRNDADHSIVRYR